MPLSGQADNHSTDPVGQKKGLPFVMTNPR